MWPFTPFLSPWKCGRATVVATKRATLVPTLQSPLWLPAQSEISQVARKTGQRTSVIRQVLDNFLKAPCDCFGLVLREILTQNCLHFPNQTHLPRQLASRVTQLSPLLVCPLEDSIPTFKESSSHGRRMDPEKGHFSFQHFTIPLATFPEVPWAVFTL